MEVGQEFEQKISLALEASGYHWKRIKTRNSGYRGDTEIADFYVYGQGYLIYIEAKTVKGTRFPFSMIQPNQLVGLNKAEKYMGVKGVFLVEFRETRNVYVVPISAVKAQLEKGKKSFSEKDLAERDDCRIIDMNNIVTEITGNT